MADSIERLVASGLLSCASDLLEAWLDCYPNDPSSLRLLARVRILQHKPQESTSLLKRATESESAEADKSSPRLRPVHPRPRFPYAADAQEFTTDDLHYLEERARGIGSRRTYYDFECEDREHGRHARNPGEDGRDDASGKNSMAGDTPKSQNRHTDYGVESAREDSTADSIAPEVVAEDEMPPTARERAAAGASMQGAHDVLDDYTEGLELLPDTAEPEEFKIQREFEEATSVADLECFEGDNLVAEPNELDEISDEWQFVTATPRDPGYDDLDWGNVDEYLYDLDDAPSREELNDEALVQATLSREERALQVAIDLGQRYGWDRDGIRLLADIFSAVRGWAATRRALERELQCGLDPQELELAAEARRIWREREDFSRNLKGHPYQYLSWPLALILVRSYRSYPDAIEIEMFLHDSHLEWTCRPSLLLQYRSFYSYVQAKLTPDSVRFLASPTVELGTYYEASDDDLLAGAFLGFNTPLRDSLETERLLPDIWKDRLSQRVIVDVSSFEGLNAEADETATARRTHAKLSSPGDPTPLSDAADSSGQAQQSSNDPPQGGRWVGNQWHGGANAAE